MRSIRDLKGLLAQSDREGPNPYLTERLLVQVRQVLEKRPYRNDFRHLNVMCHWTVHASLHDAALIYNWLERVSEAMQSIWGKGSLGLPEATKRGATILGIDGLRVQLRNFLIKEHLPTLLSDDQDRWDAFIQGLLLCIHEKQLGLPDDDAQARRHGAAYLAKQTALNNLAGFVRSMTVIISDNKFKIRVDGSGRFGGIFTVASEHPPTEYLAGPHPDTDADQIATIQWPVR